MSMTPRMGVEVDQGLLATLDKSRIPVTQKFEAEEVSGQAGYNGYTQCPYCGNIGWTNGLDTNFYISVQCGNCLRLFSA